MTALTTRRTPLFTGDARLNYLLTLPLGATAVETIRAAVPDLEVVQIDQGDATAIDRASWAQVDVLHTSTTLPDPAWAPRLRWVQLDTSGVDHLSAHPLWGSDVPLTTIGGISPVPLAEYTMWAILGCAHRLPNLLQVRESHRWPDPQSRWDTLLPAPVRGATVGIVGYGRIGREIGRLANAFGMQVLGLSRSGVATPTDGFYSGGSVHPDDTTVERLGVHQLRELMHRSDYVVVVLPRTPDTIGMVDAAALDAIQPGAVLINVARGGIVDESALRTHLRSGRISAAVLDVFDDEPLGPADGWWSEPGVFVTPHVSGLAPDYERGVLDIVCANLRRLTMHEPLLNLVDRRRGY